VGKGCSRGGTKEGAQALLSPFVSLRSEGLLKNKFCFLRVSRFRFKYNTITIHRALLKYGYSAFSLYILEYCNKEDLVSREQHYLDIYKAEYNTLKIAGSSLG
jgi:hypothetical protein